jgi:hypothetical protein
MTFRPTQLLPFAALALGIAAIALTAPPARAFTQENLSASQGGSTFADPDDRVKNFGQGGTQLFGPNGPTVQFGAQQGPGYSPYSQFNRFQGNGYNNPPPNPYAMPLGNGGN